MRAEMASEKNGRFIPLDVSKVSTYILCLSTCCYNRLLVYLFPLLRIYYYLAVLLFFFCSSPTRASPDSLLYNHAFFTMSLSQMYIVSYPTSNGLVACFYINKHNLKESPPRASMEHT